MASLYCCNAVALSRIFLVTFLLVSCAKKKSSPTEPRASTVEASLTGLKALRVIDEGACQTSGLIWSVVS